MILKFRRRLLALASAAFVSASSFAAPSVERLSEMSLEELSNLEVTSVSKAPEPLRSAPATLYVITREEILRAGVTSIAEALRLAPNLQVAQLGASSFSAGARGFAGAQEAQNFSNKLLILIDGRSVYSPLFSGVYLDAQDVVLEDVDRIEVISGPGATLWGANAMNGVINVITRASYLTDGAIAKVAAGNQERLAGARFGAKWAENLTYRVYAKAFERDEAIAANDQGAQDGWRKVQAGFRADWTPAGGSLTTQGDYYEGDQGTGPSGRGTIRGGNLLARWQQAASDPWQVQAYYDYTRRAAPGDGPAVSLDTLDLEAQQQLTRGAHRVVWGAGARLHHYGVRNTSPLIFEPGIDSLLLANVFAQDTLALRPDLDLTLGLKAERSPYSGWEPMPDVRLAWRASAQAMLWIAASRAVRSPTPFDVDVIERIGTMLALTGNKSFRPEVVDAFEIGARLQPSGSFSLSTTVFYNVYDQLRTIEPASPTQFFPLHWDNRMEGDTYGLEAWAKWQVTPTWRLAPGFRLLRKRLEFSPGASRLLGLSQSGDDPGSQALLTSSLDIGRNIAFDATLRYVGALPAPELGSWVELDAALQWHATTRLDVGVTGRNLLHASHREYPAPNGEAIPRSVMAQARWRF